MAALKDRIAARMEQLGLSRAELSRRAGRSATFIRDVLERGVQPRTDSLVALAAALEVSVEWLATADSTSAGTTRVEAVPPPTPITPPQPTDMPRDLPVMGTAAGSLGSGAFQLSSDVVDYVRRPPPLASARQAYALYVEGDSMAPKYEPGDLVFVHPARPVRAGDFVIVQVQNHEHGAVTAYIKRFERRTNEHLVLTQYNPAATIQLKTSTVRAVHRVLTANEIFGV